MEGEIELAETVPKVSNDETHRDSKTTLRKLKKDSNIMKLKEKEKNGEQTERLKAPSISISVTERFLKQLDLKKWVSATKDSRPPENFFAQQKMPFWKQILTPRGILPSYFLLAVLFFIIGAIITSTSLQTPEIILNYTQCDAKATSEFTKQEDFYWKYNSTSQICTLKFTLEQEITASSNEPLQIYYQLTNFHQNHRRYVRSFSAAQMRGENLTLGKLSDCNPLINQTNSNGDLVAFYPCGLIANSLFNDTISYFVSDEGEIYPFSEKGLAYDSEKRKFQKTTYQPSPNGTFLNIVPPPGWSSFNGVYTVDNIPNIHEDEHFIVWMRVASSANFRKIYGHSPKALPPGNWSIDVVTRFPVRDFYGTKSVVITKDNWVGGKQEVIGFAYLGVAGVFLITGLILSATRILKPRKFGDESLLSWNKDL